MPPTRSYAKTSFATMSKAKKAKHPFNQTAIDRLQKVRENATAQNSHYGQTVKRAMDSVAACPLPIETRAEALKLKYVGSHMAKIIVTSEEEGKARSLSRSSSINSSTSTATTTSNDASRKTRKRMRQTTLLSQDEESSSVASAPFKPQPSAKQIAYNKAVLEADELVLRRSGWKAILLLDDREQKGVHVQAKLQMSGIPCEKRHLPIGDMAWIARSGTQEIMLGTIVERKTTEDLVSSLFGTRYLEQRLRLQHCGLDQLLLLVEGDLSASKNCPADTLKMAMMETRIQLNFQIVQTKHLDDTVKFLKGVHRRILQRSFPSAFGELSESSLPSFRSPDAQPRPRKKKKRSLVDLVMDTPPKPPLGAERSMTYNELKARVQRDREAGTRSVGAIHQAMLKQIPTFSHKKVCAIGQAYSTPSILLQAFDGLTEKDGKTLVQDLSTNDGAERQCRIGPKSAAELYNVCTQGGDPERKPAAKSVEQPQEKPKPVKDTPKRSNVATLDKKPAPKDVPRNGQSRATCTLLESDSDESATPLQETRMPLNTPCPPAASLPAEWSCKRCTLRNASGFDFCDACGSPKPIRSTPAIPTTITSPDANDSFPLAATDYVLSQDSYSTANKDTSCRAEKNEADTTHNTSVLNTSDEGHTMFDWADETEPASAFDDCSEYQQGSPLKKSPPTASLSDEEKESQRGCVDLSQDDSLMEDNTFQERRISESATSAASLSDKCAPLRRDISLSDSPQSKDISPKCEIKDEPIPLDGKAKPKRRFVTLHSAPWDDSSSSDDDDDEPLIVRIRKRQQETTNSETACTATTEDKEDNRLCDSDCSDSDALPDESITHSSKREGHAVVREAVLEPSSSDEEDQDEESPRFHANGKSCARETKGNTKATAQKAIEVIEID